jgi:Fe-S cluster assembly protein SufD
MTAAPTPSAAPTPVATVAVASHLHPVGSFELADHPMPTGREEIWRFTPLPRLRGLLEGERSNAHLKWDVSASEQVCVGELGADAAQAMGVPAPVDRLAALAVANAGGAVLIEVPADVELDSPVIVRLSGGSPQDLVWGHVVVKVGRHAKASVVFVHEGSARYCSSVSALVDDGARLDLVSLQLWEDDAVHSAHVGLRVGRDAHVRTFQASIGGDLVRISETAEYDGPGGEVEMFGLYFADAGQHLEHRLFVDHNEPRTKSRVEYKGALQGEGARTVWIGDVLIRKVAEGIDTYEQNRNLVLTDGCRADSVPNLEIETGEIVGAGHATTTGRFDDEQLFYLQSRGLPEDEARRLVVHGFFADVIRRIGVPEIEQRLLHAVEIELERSVGLPPASAVGAR